MQTFRDDLVNTGRENGKQQKVKLKVSVPQITGGFGLPVTLQECNKKNIK